MLPHLLRSLGHALVLPALVLLLVNVARAQDPYVDRWFTYNEDAHGRLELRYTLSRGGAELYVRDSETDPGDGAVLSVAVGRFYVPCERDGTAPARVYLQRVTVLDPVTRLPVREVTADATPVPVDVRQPLGRLAALVCAAHAYAVRTGH